MNCYECNEPISEDEATWLETGSSNDPYCSTCADEKLGSFSDGDDPNDGDIFDYYRFPT